MGNEGVFIFFLFIYCLLTTSKQVPVTQETHGMKGEVCSPL